MSVETITPIVWVVFAGVCCAAFYAFYQKRIVGDLLRALIAAGADCAENAKTLSEIGYGKGVRAALSRRVLKKGSVLRKSVEALGDETPKAETKHHPDELFVKKTIDPNIRYYIPEEKRAAAEIRYDSKGTTVSTLFLTIAAFFAAAMIFIALLPSILHAIENIGKKSSDTPPKNDSAVTGELLTENADETGDNGGENADAE